MSRWLKSFLAVVILAVLASPALARKVPTIRTPTRKVPPPNAIRVPYVTSGASHFGLPVAPRIYSFPNVDSRRNPGVRAAFNLPYYGARMGFSGAANGVVEKPSLLPWRRGR